MHWISTISIGEKWRCTSFRCVFFSCQCNFMLGWIHVEQHQKQHQQQLFNLYRIVWNGFACYCFHRFCEVRNTKLEPSRAPSVCGGLCAQHNSQSMRMRITNLAKTWINVYIRSHEQPYSKTNALYWLPLR